MHLIGSLKMMQLDSLVSCICVTSHSVDLLQQAVCCFEAQSYPSKELIVLFEQNNAATKDYVKQLRLKNVFPIEVESSLNLGEKRNLALEQMHGEYFCIWDDDDWYHPSRIERQIHRLKESRRSACCIETLILYDLVEDRSYLSANRPWEGSLAASRSILVDGKRYEPLTRGEDSPLIHRLVEENRMVLEPDPYLYMYRRHGNNTCTESHWRDNYYRYALELPQSIHITLKLIAENKVSVEEGSRLLEGIRSHTT